ncbi:MAG: hypothetical protein IVW57_14465 [Ktedonobacterales bacterium]|nr:hypothetical protein [Ktedonobacterales bacterium]
MEMLREFAPFVIGMIVPPVAMIAIRAGWSGGAKFALSFSTALVLGICTSFFAGELLAGMPAALVAVVVDTSLVFTGSQLTYRSFWKPLFEPRSRPKPALEKVATRR